MIGPLERLGKAINMYDVGRTEEAVKECIEKGIDPIETSKVLTETIRKIGEKYGRFEVFLVELLMAAEAMKAGMELLPQGASLYPVWMSPLRSGICIHRRFLRWTRGIYNFHSSIIHRRICPL